MPRRRPPWASLPGVPPRRSLTLIPLALALLAPAAAHGAVRPCTAADLAGIKPPALIETDRADSFEAAVLAAGVHYRVAVIPEQALRPVTGRWADLRDGSVTASSPSVALTPRQDVASGRQVFAFTAPATARTVHIDVHYMLDLGQPATDACAATAGFDLPVRVPLPVSTTAQLLTRFKSLGPSRAPRGAGFYLDFVLPPKSGVSFLQARDQHPISVVIRVRPGALAPRPDGKATFTATYRYIGGGEFLRPARTKPPPRIAVEIHRRYWSFLGFDARGVEISCDPNAPRAGVRFALSIQVVQSGRTVGGMHGGGVCRSVRQVLRDSNGPYTRRVARITGGALFPTP